MLIALTYRCSMGCSHCLSDCTNEGDEMSLEVLNDTLNFIINNKFYTIPLFTLALSGGELYEHSNILECLNIIKYKLLPLKDFRPIIAITTNGRILSETPEYLEAAKQFIETYGKKKVFIQVTDDERFYPQKLSQKERYRLEKLGAIIEGVPLLDPTNRNHCLYPQGRAALNYDESWYYTKAPKCYNPRIMYKQLNLKSLLLLITMLSTYSYNCIPSISPTGEIKLGESKLCPACSSIYKSEKEILADIEKFDCRKCKYSLEQLKKNNEAAYNMIYK